MTTPTLDAYPVRAYDKLRYGDTDRQGHVNNAVFATFLETGRVELILDADKGLLAPGRSFVLARLEIDLVAEIHWPGTVEIGTAVTKVGRSSIALEQGIFQDGRLCARGVSVVVLVDDATRRSTALPEDAVARLEGLHLHGA